MQKKRGSAIIIAILLVTAIGSLAFSFGRLFALESANATLYENGVGAYYSAESGLEEGFLRYRYDMNAEVPFKNWAVDDKKVFRSNLATNIVNTNNTSLDGIVKTIPIAFAEASQQIYDLRMGSNVDLLGEATATDSSSIENSFSPTVLKPNPTIARDETSKFDISDIANAGEDVNFWFKPAAPSTAVATAPFANHPECTLLEGTITGQNSGGTMIQKKVMFYNSAAACTGSSNNYNGILDTNSDNVFSYTPMSSGVYEIGAIKTQIWGSATPTTATLSIKPIGADIYFTIQKKTLNSPTSLAGATNQITSSGYYGGVTRTLEADIDRQSGTAYDLFDYVIYNNK